MSKRLLGWSLLVAIVAVIGCTTGERITDLREGMTPAQVTDVMGAPTGQQRAGNVLRYEYANALISGWSWDRADFYAVFENDKLSQWGTGEVRQNQPNAGTLTVIPFPPAHQGATNMNRTIITAGALAGMLVEGAKVMISKRHLHEQEIPQGLQIYEDWVQVAGVGFRKPEAIAFARSKNLWLELEREPTNKYDEKAIKVIGCSRGLFGTKRRHIGYVPQDLAKTIVEGNFTVQPRLKYTHIGQSGFVEIEFQILGPKGQEREFTMACERRGRTPESAREGG